MKAQHLITIIFLLVYNLCNAQWWYYKNSDNTTQRKIMAIDAELVLSIGANADMILAVPNAETHLRLLLRSDYRRDRRFDKNSSFIAGTTLIAGMAIGNEIANSAFARNKTPYFALNKKKYRDRVSNNIVDLAFLQGIDPTRVRTADRQAIYRIRREIIRNYSGDEKIMRKLVFLAAALYAFDNSPQLFELLRNGEIIL